jgi:phosphoribosyl-ATP pyrophosphohydrolase/phosphoribosyl-AMP cyclohydrolase
MQIDFTKSPDGLVPVVIQDEQTLEVLMLGYMNQEAYDKTAAEKIVTFYSLKTACGPKAKPATITCM